MLSRISQYSTIQVLYQSFLTPSCYNNIIHRYFPDLYPVPNLTQPGCVSLGILEMLILPGMVGVKGHDTLRLISGPITHIHIQVAPNIMAAVLYMILDIYFGSLRCSNDRLIPFIRPVVSFIRNRLASLSRNFIFWS